MIVRIKILITYWKHKKPFPNKNKQLLNLGVLIFNHSGFHQKIESFESFKNHFQLYQYVIYLMHKKYHR